MNDSLKVVTENLYLAAKKALRNMRGTSIDLGGLQKAIEDYDNAHTVHYEWDLDYDSTHCALVRTDTASSLDLSLVNCASCKERLRAILEGN